jgi:hypothetical protein
LSSSNPEIVDVDVGSVFDLFDVNLVLLSLGFPGFFLLLVAETPVIHDLAHDGPRTGCDLDEIETLLPGEREGLFNRHHSDLISFVVNQAHRREPDPFIDSHLRCFGVLTKRELSDGRPPLVSVFVQLPSTARDG